MGRFGVDGGAQWNRNYIKYSFNKNEYIHWILMAFVPSFRKLSCWSVFLCSSSPAVVTILSQMGCWPCSNPARGIVCGLVHVRIH